MTSSTVDTENLKEFTRRAQEWWDPQGPFKPLHALNPTRVDFITSSLVDAFGLQGTSLKDLTILDVGCGGGLVAEPLARKGAQMIGLDPGIENIEAAQHHAEKEGLAIEYVCDVVETFQPKKEIDVVLALEIVEHVTSAPSFIEACLRLLKPGGVLMMSTLNRTWASFILGIVGAEYLLNWVPRGTHTWEHFIKPSELAQMIRQAGGDPKTLKGLRYHPFTNTWALSDRVDVNYFLLAQKPA